MYAIRSYYDGSRTLMLHEGKIAFDITGAERAAYEVKDLLNLFAQARTDGEELDDDKLLLVITSYSIHYTKLYETDPRFAFAGRYGTSLRQ